MISFCATSGCNVVDRHTPTIIFLFAKKVSFFRIHVERNTTYIVPIPPSSSRGRWHVARFWLVILQHTLSKALTARHWRYVSKFKQQSTGLSLHTQKKKSLTSLNHKYIISRANVPPAQFIVLSLQQIVPAVQSTFSNLRLFPHKLNRFKPTIVFILRFFFFKNKFQKKK